MIIIAGAIAVVFLVIWLDVRHERKTAQHLYDFFNRRPED